MINEATITITIFLAILTFAVPQRYFLLPFIVVACLIPADQRVIIFDLDFTPLRFCVLFGFLRIFMREETVQIDWGIFDKFVLAWAVCGAVVYVLQWGNVKALINRSGFLFDCLGMYWIFRQSIRSWQDVHFVVKMFAMMVLLSAPLVIFERLTHKNFFALFGHTVTQYHRGRFRCSGPFPHSIMMGLFWANLIPIFMAYVMANLSRAFYVVAIICCLVCVILSGSSTPIMTVLFVILAFTFYRYRRYGKQIALSFCLLILALHIVMNAPVWHLISRINVFGGSTGWHRYHLINEAIRHFGEWALIGCRSTAHWGWGLQDITNQYILEGVRGGFATLIIFILLLIQAVKIPGSYSLHRIANDRKWLSWGVCVSILGHCVSFNGVSYFGQIIMLLYLTFAMVGFIAENSLVSAESRDLHQ